MAIIENKDEGVRLVNYPDKSKEARTLSQPPYFLMSTSKVIVSPKHTCGILMVGKFQSSLV